MHRTAANGTWTRRLGLLPGVPSGAPPRAQRLQRAHLSTSTEQRASFRTLCHSSQPQDVAHISAPAVPPTSALEVLKNTSPIDRTRNQARLIFNRFDADHDGLLTQEELAAFFQYCASKSSHSPATQQQLLQHQQTFTSQLPPQQPVNLEQFVALFRSQLELIASSSYVDSLFVGPALKQVVLQSNLSRPELNKVHWRFALLDFDSDGKLSLEELQSVPGIEAQVAAGQLDDLDEDEDGFVAFEQYLATYAKPRRVWLTILVMVINTALIWALFNSPLDITIKSVAAMVLVMAPQIVNRPVIKAYEIFETIFNRGKAEMALRTA